MQRREFITLFGGTAATWPLAARAQQSSRMKRIAIVSPATKIGDMGVNGSRFYRMFFEELSRLGYVEGQNLVVERYSGEGRTEHYADLAREVVNTHPDLIFSGYDSFRVELQSRDDDDPDCNNNSRPNSRRTCVKPCTTWRKYYRR